MTVGDGAQEQRMFPLSSHVVLRLVVALVLAACNSDGVQPDDLTQPSADPPRQSSATSMPEEGGSPADGEIAIDEVEPTITPTDYGLYADAILLGGRTHRGSVDHYRFLVRCIRSQGFAVDWEPGDDGYVVHGGSQQEAASAASERCRRRAVEIGLVSGESRPADDVLRLWYRAYVEVGYPCMVEHGYPVNDPPSMETWLQQYPNTWSLYAALSPTMVADVEPTCPQDVTVLLMELGKRDGGS